MLSTLSPDCGHYSSLLIFRCILAFSSIATFAVSGFGDAPKKFSAACVKVDITPDSPQWLHGYAPRQSNGLRDRIYHRIAAIHDGTNEFYFVSTDVCTISPAYYDQFCERLQREAGIPIGHVWWSTTHTHSAPHLGPNDLGVLFGGTLGDRFSMQLDQNYWKFAQDKLVEGILEARSKLQPAKLGIGVTEAKANVNRREKNAEGKIVLGVNQDGPVDRKLNVIKLESADGKLLGVIANYAIHGTTFNGENQKISGDVTGIVADYVEANLGVPLLFINGAEGNVAPLYSVGPAIDSPLLERYKSLLGDPILDTNANISNQTADVKIQLSKTDVLTPRKDTLGWMDDLNSYTSVGDKGENLVRLPVCTLTINKDTVIWAAPLELFSEIAIDVREHSPFANTFYFGLTNGSLLYLPTAAAFSEGGYEPNVSVFTPKAAEDLSAAMHKHLRELKGKQGIVTAGN